MSYKTNGATDYLGGIYDTDDSGTTSHTTVQNIAKQHATVLSTVRASTETILMCYSIATAPKIVYREQLNSISLKKFHETDQSFYSTLDKATRNMWGFPKALFHLPPSLGGYGILSTVACCLAMFWTVVCEVVPESSVSYMPPR